MLPSRAARPPVKSGQAVAWASAAAATWARRYARAPAASTAGAPGEPALGVPGRPGAAARSRSSCARAWSASTPASTGQRAGRPANACRRRRPATPAPAPGAASWSACAGVTASASSPSLPVHPDQRPAPCRPARRAGCARVNRRAAGARGPSARAGERTSPSILAARRAGAPARRTGVPGVRGAGGTAGTGGSLTVHAQHAGGPRLDRPTTGPPARCGVRRRHNRRQPVSTRGARPAAPAADPVTIRLTGWIEPGLDAAGYDLEELVVRPAGQRSVVRVVVDRDSGVSLDDVAELSRRAVRGARRAGRGAGPVALRPRGHQPGRRPPAAVPRHWRRNVGPLVAVAVGPDGAREQLTARVLRVTTAGWCSRSEKGRAPRSGRRAVAHRAWAELGEARVQVEFDDEADGDDTSTSSTAADDDDDPAPAWATEREAGRPSRTRPARTGRDEEAASEHRRDRAQGGRAGEGHPGGHGAAGDRDRAGHRLPARRRRRQARPGADRPQERRGRRARPGVGPDGEVVHEWDDTPTDFGRIAASTAKQVIVQRLRDAENEQTFGEYAGKEGDIVSGIVQAHDRRNTQGLVLVDIGKVEAVLPAGRAGARRGLPARQPAQGLRRVGDPHLPRSAGDRSRAPTRTWCASCSRWRRPRSPTAAWRSWRWPARPGTGRRSPSAPRCPGSTPRAPASARWAQRVRNVMSELHGEKIDIVDWSDDAATFVASALSPARVTSARVVDPRGPGRAGRRPRLPAVAGHRQGGAERPAGRAAHRLPDRHPQRRPGRRRGRGALPGRRACPAALRLRRRRASRVRGVVGRPPASAPTRGTPGPAAR